MSYTLFVGFSIPADLEYKHEVLFPQLDALGFPRKDLEGDVVHVIPEERADEVQTMIEDANEKHDLGMTADFEVLIDEDAENDFWDGFGRAMGAYDRREDKRRYSIYDVYSERELL